MPRVKQYRIVLGRMGLVRFAVGWLVGAILLLNGCAWLMPAPRNDAAGQQLIARWRELNADLKPFKGLMQVRIQAQGKSITLRAAFAASAPDQLRVEVLNIIGQPLFILVSDGHDIILFSAEDSQVRHLDASEDALAPLIGIPIGIADLIDVLRGRPPLLADAFAQVSDAQGALCAVELKDRWHHPLAELHSDSCDRIQSLRRYDRNGIMQYTIEWLEWQTVGHTIVPRKVTALSDSGARVTLDIQRFWPDIELPSSTFVLNLPEIFQGAGAPR